MTTYAISQNQEREQLDKNKGIVGHLAKVCAWSGNSFAVGVGFSIHAIVNFSKASVEARQNLNPHGRGLAFCFECEYVLLLKAKGFLEITFRTAWSH